jgi:hypothetical protein
MPGRPLSKLPCARDQDSMALLHNPLAVLADAIPNEGSHTRPTSDTSFFHEGRYVLVRPIANLTFIASGLYQIRPEKWNSDPVELGILTVDDFQRLLTWYVRADALRSDQGCRTAFETSSTCLRPLGISITCVRFFGSWSQDYIRLTSSGGIRLSWQRC